MSRDLHELFTDAASSIPVGPPPDVVDLAEDASEQRRYWLPVVAAACAVGIVLVAGLGARQLTTGGAARPFSSGDVTSRSIELECANSMRAVSDGGFGMSAGADESPADMAARYAHPGQGERVVVSEVQPTGATAYVLRADGTARLRIQLIATHGHRWRIFGLEGCAGSSLLPVAD